VNQQINEIQIPEEHECKRNDTIMALADMLGRKTRGKRGYNWDDPEYMALEAAIDDNMAEIGLAMGYFSKRTAADMAEITSKPEAFCHEQMQKLAESGVCLVDQVNGIDTFWLNENFFDRI